MKSAQRLLSELLSPVTVGVASVLLATIAQGASDGFTRDHENGATAVRFHRGLFHYALILDGRPRVNDGRDLVTAGGRRIPLH